jgi:hypothetical protein
MIIRPGFGYWWAPSLEDLARGLPYLSNARKVYVVRFGVGEDVLVETTLDDGRHAFETKLSQLSELGED